LRKNGASPTEGGRAHPRPPVAKPGADAPHGHGQEHEQAAGDELGTQDRADAGDRGREKIEGLDPGRDIGGGIGGEEIRRVQARIEPARHPEKLLAHVVIDDKRRQEGVPVGDEKNEQGAAGDEQGVEPAKTSLRWRGHRGGRSCSGRPRNPAGSCSTVPGIRGSGNSRRKPWSGGFPESW